MYITATHRSLHAIMVYEPDVFAVIVGEFDDN